MKLKLIGLAIGLANLTFSQSLLPADSIYMSGLLTQIELLSLIDTLEVSENNVFIPIERLIQRTEGANIISRGNFAQDPMLRSYKNSQINVKIWSAVVIVQSEFAPITIQKIVLAITVLITSQTT